MRPSRWRAIASNPSLTLVACLLVASALSSAAEASVDGDEAAVTARMEDTGRVVPVPPSPYKPAYATDAQAMWIWHKGDRAFFLHNANMGRRWYDQAQYEYGDTWDNFGPQHSQLSAVDLQTGKEIGRLKLAPGTTAIHQQSISVDEAGGRLFIPYVMVRPIDATGNHSPAVDPARGEACVSPNQNYECVNGFYVIDAATLQIIDRISLRVPSPDGLLSGAYALWATSYVPGEPGSAGKLLMLVAEETVPEQRWDSFALPHDAGLDWRNQTQTHLVYAVQIDIASRSAEWTTRVEACRSRRDYRNIGDHRKIDLRSWRALIFRSATQSAVVVACSTGGGAQQAVFVHIPVDANGQPYALPVAAASSSLSASPANPPPPASMVEAKRSPAHKVFTGPNNTTDFLYDAGSERLLARVVSGTPKSEAYWVFDSRGWAVIGVVGIGALTSNGSQGASINGVDPATGRLYVLVHPDTGRGGFYLTDIRRDPLPQALFFPGFEDLWRHKASVMEVSQYPLVVRSAAGDRPTEVHVANAPGNPGMTATHWKIIRDNVAVSVGTSDANEIGGRTIDLPEKAGVTEAAFDGVARGYGLRALLVGGIEATGRVGPVDPVGFYLQWEDYPPMSSTETLIPTTPRSGFRYGQTAPRSACSGPNREIVVGAVGLTQPAVVDVSGSRGGAEPLTIDSGTTADLFAPGSRCTGKDWKALWASALFGRAPVEEPSVALPAEAEPAACLSSDADRTDASGDPVTGVYAAQVGCEDEDVSGYAYARAVPLPTGAGVAEALSSFRVYRDPGRGIVSRVESVARAFWIPGVVRVDTVRGVAESWANGRSFTPPDDTGYNPDCDYSRTAGTCFQRHIFGVWTPAYRCGPCGDEHALVDGLSRAMGQYGTARLRDPDAQLAQGADNGSIAAVVKPQEERFPDVVLHNDLLQTVLPTLEIVRQAPPNRTHTGGGSPGRQIYQLAGVEVSSSYGIACLLVYDADANTCSSPKEPPAAITVTLADGSGAALAGGTFAIHRDADGDGLLGLTDKLLPDGVCTTTDDGIGSCVFEELEPGAYLVQQVAAPKGFSAAAEPFPVSLASGERRTVTFTNAPSVSTVHIAVTDEHGKPIAGGSFAAYPDADGDGKLTADAAAAATCTTDEAGVCEMRVPAGNYVLVQTSSAAGLQPIEPVAFTFASAGQTASVAVVNYPMGIAPIESPMPRPRYETADPIPPTVSTEAYTAPEGAAETPQPQPQFASRAGGTIVRVIRAPGDMLRLLSRDATQASAWLASVALLCLALSAVYRYRSLQSLLVSPGGQPPRQGRQHVHPPSPSGPAPAGGRGSPSPGAGTGHGRGSLSRPSPRPGEHTLLRERPAVKGGASGFVDGAGIPTIAAFSGEPLALLVADKLAQAADCDLVEVAHSRSGLHAALRRRSPRIVVLDLSLLLEGGSDHWTELAADHPLQSVIGVIPTDAPVARLTVDGYRAGLGGILVSPDDLANGHLAFAVRSVAAGRPCYGPAAQAVLFDRLRRRGGERLMDGTLSARELEVAVLAVEGLGRREIAQRLYLSPWTVKRHMVSIREKLGVDDPFDREQLRTRLREIVARQGKWSNPG